MGSAGRPKALCMEFVEDSWTEDIHREKNRQMGRRNFTH